MSEHEPVLPETESSLGMLAKILGGVGVIAAASATAYVAKKIVDSRQHDESPASGGENEDI